jgi:dTDP-4-dehydrorhamnose 3,5-epimerase
LLTVFVVLSDTADFLYKTTDYYAPHERCISWSDPEVGIEWPLAKYQIDVPQLSEKDKQGATPGYLRSRIIGAPHVA